MINELAVELGKILLKNNLICSTAESCTGGMVSSAITDVAGSSQWFECAFITYSNQAKHEMLGVPLEILETFGAVSQQTVKEMAIRALKLSNAQISVAISGIAGPGGATPNKKVGTVCFAFASENKETAIYTKHFNGNRLDVRQQSTIFALQVLINAAKNEFKSAIS